MTSAPLNVTVDPKLDAAMGAGLEAWEKAARAAGLARVTAWASRRAGDEVPRDDLREHIGALLVAQDPDEEAFARAELAELLAESDDALADLLWEGVLERGLETDDPDLIFEATTHLSAIAEDLSDPLAAAEYFIDFLNWRRRPGSVSDPESVQTAFEEIIRLAEIDGQPQVCAAFSYRQVGYTKLVDAEDDAATSGDWETDSAPYSSWS